MQTYIAIAYRWGNLNAHWYLVYAGSDETKAHALAENETHHRGGKYGCAVVRANENGDEFESIGYYPSMGGEERPFHNHRIDMFESLGHKMHDFANGRIYLRDDTPFLKPTNVDPPQWVKDEVKRAEEMAEMMADFPKKIVEPPPPKTSA
jgi:hypothetical protein